MRHVLLFAVIMAMLTIPARCKAAAPTAEDELAKAAFAFEVAKLNLKSPVIAKKTTCGCAATGKCLCYVGECQCAACGLGVAAKQAGKPQVSSGTPAIPVRPAATPAAQAPAPGSSVDTPPTVTSTNVPYALSGGSISGCANGQCQSSSSTGRRFFRR